MAQSVVPKKQEKLEKLFDKYGSDISLEYFKEKFKNDYPKDFERIEKNYNKQVVLPKKDGKKPGPMPAPEKYLEQMYKGFKH